MNQQIPNYRVYGDFDTDFSLSPIHVDDVKKSTAQNNWMIVPHRHDDLCHLVYFSSGGGEIQLGTDSFEFKAPFLATVPAGEVHGFHVQQNIDGTILTISKPYLERVLAGSEPCLQILDQGMRIQGDAHNEFFSEAAALLKRIGIEYAERQFARDIAMQSLVGYVYCLLARLNSTPSFSDAGSPTQDHSLWYFRQFQNLVGHLMTEKRSVADYAVQLRISATHLNRICRAVAGKTALQIIHERLINEAKINLAYTFQSVSEVAYKLGFDDISYFSNFFKKHTGVTPRAFKESVRQAD